MSGLRRGEAILSFNKIIELNDKGLLSEYYDKNLSCLLHFKYREFIRGSKNCLITFIKESFTNQIANLNQYMIEPYIIECLNKILNVE